MAFACLIVSSDSRANDTWDIQLSEQELKRIADGTLTLMAFSVLPDISTSSLSINKGAADDPGIWQSTFGGGFTVGKDYPLYLEGSFGYSRYDPDFIATRGIDFQIKILAALSLVNV
jgi:hypothetical protein